MCISLSLIISILCKEHLETTTQFIFIGSTIHTGVRIQVLHTCHSILFNFVSKISDWYLYAKADLGWCHVYHILSFIDVSFTLTTNQSISQSSFLISHNIFSLFSSNSWMIW